MVDSHAKAPTKAPITVRNMYGLRSFWFGSLLRLRMSNKATLSLSNYFQSRKGTTKMGSFSVRVPGSGHGRATLDNHRHICGCRGPSPQPSLTDHKTSPFRGEPVSAPAPMWSINTIHLTPGDRTPRDWLGLLN